jgi:citrate lyase subunit beta-like protein
MRARRALLFVPGDDRHKAEKAAGLNADCICLDLEDGVAVNRKDEARTQVAQSLANLDFHGAERLVRLNALSSGLCQSDLDAILPAHPDGVYLPKVNTAAEIQWINEYILAFEKREAVKTGTVSLIVGIESALALLNLQDICRASNRLSGLVFGAEDYIADLGGVRTSDGEAVFHARCVLVTCATAYNLQAVDMVCTDYKDQGQLEKECRSGVALGFSGKQVIHPAQVEPVQRMFTPDAAAVEKATRIIKTYQENLSAGKGAFTLDGKMVDLPVVKAAERLLARAEGYTKKI